MPDAKIATLGCFRILSDLKTGAGSQGAVYKAVCEREGFEGVSPGTVVALKVMLAQDGADRYARLRSRTAELKALDHPNVVRYYGCFSECGTFSELHVVVLEFLEGASLKDLLAGSPRGLDADEALRIAGQALDGLRYLSDHGLVHRDIKPGNVFVCSDGRVKLIDFEVARREDSAATTVGGMIGTFDYMAPEFVNPDFRGDEASDIFSFAVTLHEMLTGRTPYRVGREGDSQSTFAFMSRWSGHSAEQPAIQISVRVRRILSGADDVLARALAPDRAVRYGSFAEFAKDFAKIRFRELAYGGSRWQLLLHVGRGGFGEVFKARDTETGRLVAIKHLLRTEAADRFRREARIMGEVRAPHLVQLVAYFEMKEKGSTSPFLVMDYLPGMPGLSLRDAIKEADGDPLPRQPVLQAFLRYARALSALHRRGLFHRDIKPANLYFPMKTPERSAIMDFGIVRDASGTATVGQIPGTLDYMPPESVEDGKRGDSAMDIYALGLSLYEALSGRTAYPRIPSGPGGMKVFFERAQAKKPPKLDASAYCDCPELVRLVRDMTEPVVANRLRSMAEVERRIADILGLAAANTGRQSDGFVLAEDAEPLPEEPQTAATIVADAEALDRLQDLKPAPEPRKRRAGRLVFGLTAGLLAVFCLAIGGLQFLRVRQERQQFQDMEKQAAKERAAAERRRRIEADAAAEAERKRQAELAAAEAERKRQADLAAAEAERKRQAELAAAEAERKRKAASLEELAQKRMREEKKRRVDAEIAEVEAVLKQEESAYLLKRKKALKPGSREDPNELDVRWYMRKRDLLRKIRKLEQSVK